MKLFPSLFILLLLSCRNCPTKVSAHTLSLCSLNYDSQLTISSEDTLLLQSSRSKHHPFPHYFDSIHSFCKLQDDTLKIYLSTGMFEGSYFMNFFVINDTAYTTLNLFNDHPKFKHTPDSYSLILNAKRYKTGDYLVAKIDYTATGAAIYDPGYRDTVLIAGKLKLKIRSPEFSFKDLYIENQRNEFYALLQRPDTVTQLNLYGCAFTELPRELAYFTNLQSLSLDGNELSKANFASLFNLNNLRSLSLNDCNLYTFPSSILTLSKLENLNVYNNKLASIPDELYTLTNLKELCIGYNNLSYLSPKISNLKNLVSLETSATNINRYPDEMTKLTKLTEIYPNDTMLYVPAPLIKHMWGCDTILNK